MAISDLRFIKRCAEFCPKDEWRKVPRRTRGIYALLKKRPGKRPSFDKYDVVYIGMAAKDTGMGGQAVVSSEE